MSVVDTLINELRNNPGDFCLDGRVGYCLVHRPSGVNIWTANGFWFCGVWDNENSRHGMRFTFWEKVRIWPRVRSMICRLKQEVQAKETDRVKSMLQHGSPVNDRSNGQ